MFVMFYAGVLECVLLSRTGCDGIENETAMLCSQAWDVLEYDRIIDCRWKKCKKQKEMADWADDQILRVMFLIDICHFPV